MVDMRTVRPGQVWADNDKRAVGRKVRVDRIDGDYANCTVVADRDKPQVQVRGRYNNDRPPGWSPVGFRTLILLRRFRPTSPGYRLIEDAPPREAEDLPAMPLTDDPDAWASWWRDDMGVDPDTFADPPQPHDALAAARGWTPSTSYKLGDVFRDVHCDAMVIIGKGSAPN